MVVVGVAEPLTFSVKLKIRFHAALKHHIFRLVKHSFGTFFSFLKKGNIRSVSPGREASRQPPFLLLRCVSKFTGGGGVYTLWRNCGKKKKSLLVLQPCNS